jgi:hypothetical protein
MPSSSVIDRLYDWHQELKFSFLNCPAPNSKADHDCALGNHSVPNVRAGGLKIGTRPCLVPLL